MSISDYHEKILKAIESTDETDDHFKEVQIALCMVLGAYCSLSTNKYHALGVNIGVIAGIVADDDEEAAQ